MRFIISIVSLLLSPVWAFSAEDGIAGIYNPGALKPTDSELRVSLGQEAPDFELPSVDGKRVKLSDYRGNQHVIISFVPAAWTPVCSAQWPGYNLMEEDFADLGAVMVGITVDNIPTLHAWEEAMEGIAFPVLSDFFPHGKVAKQFGILRSDGTTERALFIIDKEGIIRFIDVHDINVRPPMEDLFNALEQINQSAK